MASMLRGGRGTAATLCSDFSEGEHKAKESFLSLALRLEDERKHCHAERVKMSSKTNSPSLSVTRQQGRRDCRTQAGQQLPAQAGGNSGKSQTARKKKKKRQRRLQTLLECEPSVIDRKGDRHSLNDMNIRPGCNLPASSNILETPVCLFHYDPEMEHEIKKEVFRYWRRTVRNAKALVTRETDSMRRYFGHRNGKQRHLRSFTDSIQSDHSEDSDGVDEILDGSSGHDLVNLNTLLKRLEKMKLQNAEDDNFFLITDSFPVNSSTDFGKRARNNMSFVSSKAFGSGKYMTENDSCVIMTNVPAHTGHPIKDVASQNLCKKSAADFPLCNSEDFRFETLSNQTRHNEKYATSSTSGRELSKCVLALPRLNTPRSGNK